MKSRLHLVAITLTLAIAPSVFAQSSSLYVQQQGGPGASPAFVHGRVDRLSPSIAVSSFSAVRLPEPRRFAINDLISIIIRESSSNDTTASLETEKETTLDGEISAFPNLQLKDLLNFQLGQSDMSRGTLAATFMKSVSALRPRFNITAGW